MLLDVYQPGKSCGVEYFGRSAAQVFSSNGFHHFCSFGVILLSFAAMGLYRLQYFRYAALAATLILAFAFRKRLIAVFHQIGKGGAEDEE